MKTGFLIKFILFVLLSTAVLITLGFILRAFDPVSSPSENATPTSAPAYLTVIIDAGHGGEDGGAVSLAGLVEKDVNLSIAHILRDMLRANDINVVMTREDDRLLYDKNVDYKGKKKKLDLDARIAIAESTPNAILVSIHMNSFTVSKYSGLQVWYSPNNAVSCELAELIQNNCHEKLQPSNSRSTKVANSTIRLLNEATCPAVLVECGFLSNPEEAAMLGTQEYRQKIAFLLFCSITEFLEQSGG
ncbi:MAG: N-acetylmuramoyl-L-alanine amidase [Clostridia bacterium]|nr:N-acetylmuramoyl-L-alanine amidase [Clostridia bacterium]